MKKTALSIAVILVAVSIFFSFCHKESDIRLAVLPNGDTIKPYMSDTLVAHLTSNYIKVTKLCNKCRWEAAGSSIDQGLIPQKIIMDTTRSNGQIMVTTIAKLIGKQKNE